MLQHCVNGHGGDDADDGFRDGVDADRRHQQRNDGVAQHGLIGFFEEDPDAAQHADGIDERTAQSAQGCGSTAILAFEPLIDRAGPIAQGDARDEGDQQAGPVSFHAAHGEERREAEAGDRRREGRVVK